MVSDVTSEMDKGVDLANLQKDSLVQNFVRSQPDGCQIKKPSQPRFPSLEHDETIEHDEIVKTNSGWFWLIQSSTKFKLSSKSLQLSHLFNVKI